LAAAPAGISICASAQSAWSLSMLSPPSETLGAGCELGERTRMVTAWSPFRGALGCRRRSLAVAMTWKEMELRLCLFIVDADVA